MRQQAQVTSIEALESFRANLIIYLSKARPTLEEVGDDVHRMRDWLQNDCQRHWQNEIRRRRRAFDEAQQNLFSARLSSFQEPTAAQQWAVTRAWRELVAAEDKLKRLKKWCREFDNLTDPLVKELDQLHTFLVSELPHAAAFLAQAVKTLQVYAALAPAAASGEANPPNETDGLARVAAPESDAQDISGQERS